jgi:hypothetical protein
MSNSIRFLQEFNSTTTQVDDYTNVFGRGFDIYKIIVTPTDNSTTGAMLSIRFIDSSGSVITAGEYWYGSKELKDFASFDEHREAGGDKFKIGPAGNTHSLGGGTIVYIYDPDDSAKYTYAISHGMSNSDSGVRGYKGHGVHRSAETITGFRLYQGSGTNAKNVRIYGVA